MKPHRVEYWLTAKREDPQAFQAEVQTVCQTYLDASKLAESKQVHTVSVDEKTGIQALERNVPNKPMKPGSPEKIEYEYQRHGTLCLFGNLDVVTGKIVAPMIRTTRSEQDFADHIRQTLALDPLGEWIFVVDNLNTHMSESLVKLVAEHCGIVSDFGIKGKSGILKSKATRKTFLESSEHRIRFVYTPKHTSWLNQIECWFSTLVRRALKRGSFTSTSALRERILEFIDYYNRSAKPFKWTYTGRPLNV